MRTTRSRLAATSRIVVGTVSSLWRYPVKSMLGEELAAADVLRGGLLGDRGCALIDRETGRVASAKNPRKWSGLLGCTATYAHPPRVASLLPPVRMIVGDGSSISSTQRDRDAMLTRVFDRAVTLVTNAPVSARQEEFWPDMDGLEPLGEPVVNPDQETITALPVGFSSPVGTLFDFAVLHLLTTATLSRLHELYPDGRFEVQRFRPNIVVDLGQQEPGFAENAWVNQVLAIGDGVRLKVTVATPRCVMTTLAQRDLPRDLGVLRTAAQHNRVPVGDLGAMACVGVYADVLSPGSIRCGDVVRLE